MQIEQREIKFRAWDREKKEMIYQSDVNQVVIANDGWHIQKWDWFPELKVFQYRNLAHMNDSDLMQYTNLKDKNGKEIYEGDILGNKKCLADAVIWWRPYGNWSMKNTQNDFIGTPWGHQSLEMFLRFDAEVIGNIYENPELCK